MDEARSGRVRSANEHDSADLAKHPSLVRALYPIKLTTNGFCKNRYSPYSGKQSCKLSRSTFMTVRTETRFSSFSCFDYLHIGTYLANFVAMMVHRVPSPGLDSG